MATDIKALLERVKQLKGKVGTAEKKYGGETTVKEAMQRETGLPSIRETTTGTKTKTPSQTTPSPQPETKPQPKSYTVQSGDTLSAIAQRQGVSLEEVKRSNPQLERGRNFDLIYPGDVVNIPGVEGSERITDRVTEETTGVGTSEREKEGQEEIDTEKEFEDEIAEVDLESDALKRISNLKKQREEAGLDPDTGLPLTETPKPPTYYSEDDINSIENLGSEINDLKATIRDVEASVTQGMYDQEGRLAPMELIGTRQRELQRQAQEQLDTLNRSLQTKIDAYNNKLSGIEMTANIRKMEWADSKWEYQQQYNKAIALSNYFAKEEDEIVQDAKANLTAIQNGLAQSDMTWDELSPEYQSKIRELEQVSGIPTGTTQLFYNEEPDAEVMWGGAGVDSQGNDIVTFIYKDKDGKPGSKEVVYTGGKSKVSGDGGGPGEGGIIDMTSTQYNKAIETSGLSEEDFSKLDEMSQRIFAFGDIKATEKQIQKDLEEGKKTPEEIKREISEDPNYPDPIKNHFVKYLEGKRGGVEEKEEELNEKVSQNIDAVVDEALGVKGIAKIIDDMEDKEDMETINETIEKINKAADKAKRLIEGGRITLNKTKFQLTDENKREILNKIEERKNELIEKVRDKRSWWEKLKERGRYTPPNK